MLDRDKAKKEALTAKRRLRILRPIIYEGKENLSREEKMDPDRLEVTLTFGRKVILKKSIIIDIESEDWAEIGKALIDAGVSE